MIARNGSTCRICLLKSPHKREGFNETTTGMPIRIAVCTIGLSPTSRRQFAGHTAGLLGRLSLWRCPIAVHYFNRRTAVCPAMERLWKANVRESDCLSTPGG